MVGHGIEREVEMLMDYEGSVSEPRREVIAISERAFREQMLVKGEIFIVHLHYVD